MSRKALGGRHSKRVGVTCQVTRTRDRESVELRNIDRFIKPAAGRLSGDPYAANERETTAPDTVKNCV